MSDHPPFFSRSAYLACEWWLWMIFPFERLKEKNRIFMWKKIPSFIILFKITSKKLWLTCWSHMVWVVSWMISCGSRLMTLLLMCFCKKSSLLYLFSFFFFKINNKIRILMKFPTNIIRVHFMGNDGKRNKKKEICSKKKGRSFVRVVERKAVGIYGSR